jgi:hypothetical protein
MKHGSKSLQKQTKGTKGTVIPNEWGVNSFAGEMISAALILGIFALPQLSPMVRAGLAISVCRTWRVIKPPTFTIFGCGLNTDETRILPSRMKENRISRKPESSVAQCVSPAHGTIEILKLFLNGAERQLRPYHILSWQSSY